jgi:hypothetical protein
VIAQLGERQTEDLKVLGPIPGHGKNAIIIQMKMKRNTVSPTGKWELMSSDSSVGRALD